MRVCAINYSTPTAKFNSRTLRNSEVPSAENPNTATTPADTVSFKGKADKAAVGIMGTLGAIAGGVVGFCVGGPIGAAAGAALVGGLGAKEAHEENKQIEEDRKNGGGSGSDDYDPDIYHNREY